MTDAAFWDRIAPRYAKSPIKNMPAYKATLEAVKAYLGETDRVLEMGCGTGGTALKLAPHVARYTGTDISEAMIGIARDKQATARTPGLDFAVAGAADDAFEAGSFDAVLGFNLLHLVPDLDEAVAQAHRLLKPGGLYITKSGCLKNMNPLLRMLLPVMRWLGKAPHVNVFSREELEAQIQAGGFDIVEARSFTGAPATWFVVARRR